MKLYSVIVFSVFVLSLSLSAQSNRLSYEPKIVRMTGAIERDTFPGRPNYGNIKNGDEREIYWVLKLTKPVCVNGSKGDEVNETEENVTKMQLVFLNPSRQYQRYGRFVGHKVIVTGKLFHAASAHHKTKVLINVAKIVAG